MAQQDSHPKAEASAPAPAPAPALPTIAQLLARAAPGGPREALAAADGDPGAALALAVHALFVEVGFRSIRGPALAPAPSAGPSPSASLDGPAWAAGKAAAAPGLAGGGAPSSSSSGASAYAPPSGWCRRPGAPDEWVFRYTHRGKASPFVLHLSLQRASGRMLARAAEEEEGQGLGSSAGGGDVAAAGPAPPPGQSSSLQMMPLTNGGVGGGGGGGMSAFGPGAAVGPPPSRNQRMLGLQLGNYVSAPAEALRQCRDWSEAGVLGPRADEALRSMVREHLAGPLLEAAEDAPAFDEEEMAVEEGVAAGRGGGGGGRPPLNWRADRVVGALAIGVGLAVIAAGVAYAVGPQRRARVRDALRTAAARVGGGQR